MIFPALAPRRSVFFSMVTITALAHMYPASRFPEIPLYLLLLLVLVLPDRAVAASQEVSRSLRQQVEQIALHGRADQSGEIIRQPLFLHDVYAREGFTPLWGRPEQVDQLLAAIAECGRDGLRPADYHQRALLTFKRTGDRATDAATVAAHDILLTDALLSLGFDTLYGKTDTRDIETTWNLDPPRKQSMVRPLMTALKEDRLARMLSRIGPAQSFYADLKETLAAHRKMADQGGWPVVPDGPTLKPGMRDARVEALRRRLLVTGELVGLGREPQVFDQEVRAAVEAFQKRHFLEPDGIVGKNVLAALNVPVEDRIDQIRVNLERARWVFHNVPATFVVVDIAGFTLRYTHQGQLAWSTRVVVGQPFSQTPIFRSEINQMVLHPTWTIPAGIASKEIVPAVVKTSGYLKEQRLRLFDANGREIPAASINFRKYIGTSFPYTFRQDAGPEGALGRIKFNFANPYSVYLHDTPSKGGFGRTSRAFSHGCIRVEHPLDLGRLLLRNDSGNRATVADMDRMLAEGTTRSINLKTPVPVYLLYWTAQVREGVVWFKPDLYGRDRQVLHALNGPPRPPAANPDRGSRR